MGLGAVKVIGIIATIGGAACTIASNWVADKKLDDKIDTKVAEALADKK